MTPIHFDFKICFRITRRKPTIYLAATTLVILIYLNVLFYLANFKPSLQEHIFSQYEQSPYDTEVAGSQLRKYDKTCIERTNFVFIKSMKCATTTLLGVFYRFGYVRNLSFVSPVGNFIYLNWPFPMTMRDFRPSSHGYNILTDHAIYTESVMDTIMPKDTIYISIIREPFAQMKSTFHYFNIAKISGVPENVTNHIIEYFSHLEKYESAYMAHGATARWCIPDGFSVTKNLMSHCHGMPLGFPPGTKNITTDNAAVEQYIRKLDSKFSLIMIVEYFFESLVLLRRLMCWTFRDIIFVHVNSGDYSIKFASVPENIVNIHKQWSSADYKLYNYFNNTFWKQISHQSSDFYKEVEAFKLVAKQVQNYCLQLYKSFRVDEYPVNMTEIVVEATEWSDKFSVTSKDCWMLGPNPYILAHAVQKENDVKEAPLLAEQQKILDNRTLKGFC